MSLQEGIKGPFLKRSTSTDRIRVPRISSSPFESSLSPSETRRHHECRLLNDCVEKVACWAEPALIPFVNGSESLAMTGERTVMQESLFYGFSQNGMALNCEDGIVFADEALRSELLVRDPEVFQRIGARQAFIRDELGVALKETVLSLSSTPQCLPPFWLTASRLFARSRARGLSRNFGAGRTIPIIC